MTRPFQLLAIPALLAAAPLQAQAVLPQEEKEEACTSIMVGRLASTDGSVMTSHSCDGNYRSWLRVEPRKQHAPGSVREVWWGGLHTESPLDQTGKKLKGGIPQVRETFAYVNSGYPFLNERQVAIGETTITGRRELVNDKGLFLVEELEAIALERCSTAREAVQLMGRLAEQYGYGDGGEALTVADPKEVWHFEILGAGKASVGAVWAAVRIPDDHVGVSANIPRIAELDLKQPDRFMASKNVFSLAQANGWWDPAKEPFKFWKAYNGRKPFAIREFFILSSLAPSLNLRMDMEELPLTVKPAHQVSPKEVFAFFRQTYEGTPYDKTRNLLMAKARRREDPPLKEGEVAPLVKSPVANPWMHADLMATLNQAKPGLVENQRTVAVPQCAYSHVIQCRGWLPDEVGAVAWFALDNPGQSPRIPIFSGTLALPEAFEVCMNKQSRPDAAGWAFRRANRLAQVRWGQAREIQEKAVQAFETKGQAELPGVERAVQDILKADPSPAGHAQAREYLTRYTGDFARAAMQRWQEMGDEFWALFGRGF
jgi:dipeptidase